MPGPRTLTFTLQRATTNNNLGVCKTGQPAKLGFTTLFQSQQKPHQVAVTLVLMDRGDNQTSSPPCQQSSTLSSDHKAS